MCLSPLLYYPRGIIVTCSQRISPEKNRPDKCLGVRHRSRRVERPRRTDGQHPAATARMLPGERGAGVTWLELPIQQHAALVHFRHTRGQPYY